MDPHSIFLATGFLLFDLKTMYCLPVQKLPQQYSSIIVGC